MHMQNILHSPKETEYTIFSPFPHRLQKTSHLDQDKHELILFYWYLYQIYKLESISSIEKKILWRIVFFE